MHADISLPFDFNMSSVPVWIPDAKQGLLTKPIATAADTAATSLWMWAPGVSCPEPMAAVPPANIFELGEKDEPLKTYHHHLTSPHFTMPPTPNRPNITIATVIGAIIVALGLGAIGIGFTLFQRQH